MKLFVYYSRKWDKLYLGDEDGRGVDILNYTTKTFKFKHAFWGDTVVPKGTMSFIYQRKIPSTFVLLGEY